MADVYRSPCGLIELRLGRWQDVLFDVEPDHIIADPPYSARTHEGQRTGSSPKQSTIGYDPIDPEWVKGFVGFWAKREPKWVVVFCDHPAFDWWAEHWYGANYYVFERLGWVKPDAAPRMQGDGPTCSIEPLLVARKRDRAVCNGARPGHYVCNSAKTGHPGAKPLGLMRALIRDYSRPNDLIVDPVAGSGSGLLAAAMEGRRAIGAEVNPDTYRLAVARLRQGYTPTLF